MFKNLEAEMTRKDVSSEKLAHTIGRSYNSIRHRLNGKIPFTVDEALIIKKKLFPECSLDYLFQKEGES